MQNKYLELQTIELACYFDSCAGDKDEEDDKNFKGGASTKEELL